jgi:nitrate/TMAO reductase-like tetraheme cytochrome c subunit
MKNIFRIIFLLFLLLLIAITGINAQVSPGELSQGHANLEGVDNCTQCHDPGNKVSNTKCLACHKEIKAKIEQKRGYHASAEVRGKQCSTCHNEHHGKKFKLIKFNKEKFNHDLTGFKLEGEHAKQECENCHNAEHIKDPRLKKKKGTYIGIEPTCLTCHDDYHQGKLSSNCAECHNFNSFEKAKAFDHSKTRFPLLGKHKKVSCKECHKEIKTGDKTRQNFANLKFSNCNACHEDPHNNRFGQDCKSCHQESSFRDIKNIEKFDHDKTDYKLEGKHRLVACKECHKGKMTTPVKHETCTDCHKDFHEGQFDKGGKKPDCKTCHSIYGFKPAEYGIEKHNQGKFPLKGAHLATSCTDCHLKEGKWKFRNMGERCVDCHENIHKGKMEEKFNPGENCTTCHTERNWEVSGFNHDETGYKLTGSHASVSCGECHYKKDKTGKKIQIFKGLSKECSACHEDSHAGQFEVNGITDCERCHDTGKWEKTHFNHDTARFKLDGAHANLECSECHKQVTTEKGTFIQHKFQDISCAACHGSTKN